MAEENTEGNAACSTRITEKKLYFGNVSPEVTESDMVELFKKHNIICSSIEIKEGEASKSALVDFPDQSTADKAIDIFLGSDFHGLMLMVEPLKKLDNIQENLSRRTRRKKKGVTPNKK